MRIIFTKHFFERYTERISKIDGSHIFECNGKEYVKIESVEREIRKGSFYANKSNRHNILILYNNLKIYRGEVCNINGEEVLVIGTVYPYRKTHRGWINYHFERIYDFSKIWFLSSS